MSHEEQSSTLIYFRFSVNGQATGWCSQGCQAMVDTGTSLLTIPQQFLGTFLQYVGAQESQNGEVREEK